MNLNEAIYSRKSIRSYTGERISDNELKKILDVAQVAPIGMKQYDSIRITVISNKEMLNEIEIKSGEAMGKPGMKCLYGAPTYILISVKEDKMIPTAHHSSASTIIENMLLKATDLGVGACCVWGPVVALSKNRELLNKLNIPEDFVPSAGIVIGKTNEKYEIRNINENKIKINEI